MISHEKGHRSGNSHQSPCCCVVSWSIIEVEWDLSFVLQMRSMRFRYLTICQRTSVQPVTGLKSKSMHKKLLCIYSNLKQISNKFLTKQRLKTSCDKITSSYWCRLWWAWVDRSALPVLVQHIKITAGATVDTSLRGFSLEGTKLSLHTGNSDISGAGSSVSLWANLPLLISTTMWWTEGHKHTSEKMQEKPDCHIL